MKSRHKRLALIGGAVAVLGAIVGLVLFALSGNINHFYSPTEVADGKAPKEKVFRVGGLVKQGTLQREADGVTMSFVVTDTDKDLAVNYKGILPDLFKEGKGAVVEGKFNGEGRFVANTVLAKHDENYMPPEAAKAVGEAHKRAADKRAAGQPGEAPAPAAASAPAPAKTAAGY